jgi:hypothetical protein
LVKDQGALQPLWAAAEQALESASSVVMIGYSMPPSDAYSRSWLINALRKNRRLPKDEALLIHTVMGTDVVGRDSMRLKGLLESTRRIIVRQKQMFGEDYLDIFDRQAILEGWG